jgi:hypothetical protein
MKFLAVIGAQRSGSTYLYQLLNNHPQIVMAEPVFPEPKFFLDENLFNKGKKYYQKKYFNNIDDKTLYVGEKSTSYIEHITSALRIKEFYPDARILIILRDPVARAYSNYCFSRENQLETLTFAKALNAEKQRLTDKQLTTSVNPFAYRERGNYINYIEPYFEIFNQNQIKVLIFEELVNSIEYTKDLYKWLGVDSQFVPDSLSKVYNKVTILQNDQPIHVFKDLAVGYQDSISQLEKKIVGLSLNIWRNNHKKIISS